MAWVRIDDHLDEHPKIAQAGPLGLALFVAGLAYCNRNLTDGYIPRAVALTLLEFSHPDHDGNPLPISVTNGMQGHDITAQDVIDTLLELRLWKTARGGYQVHDYHDYQPTKARVLADRKAARDRMKNHRNSRGSHEQTKNFPESSDQVREKFNDPVPVPNPKPQDQGLRTTAAAGTRANPPAAAAHELEHTLRNLDFGDQETAAALAEPTRAWAWIHHAEIHATESVGGYAWANFQRGGWPPDTPDQQKPKVPLLDVARNLVERFATEYPDDALLDELDKIERKRDEKLTDDEREQLLEHAHQLRHQTTAA
jgi:hypothetical protein